MRPKDIGTAAETAYVRFLQDNGFPNAERRALRGRYDCGDVTGTIGVAHEVKVRDPYPSLGEIAAFMLETETEAENAKADFGILIVRVKGKSVPGWAAYMFVRDVIALHVDGSNWETPALRMFTRFTVSDAITMIRHCGYGEAP